MMNLGKSINLRLRRYGFCAYNRIAPLIVKTRLTKLRLGKKTLGLIIRSLFVKVMHSNLPDPIETQGIIMYHRTPGGRGDWGWCYAFDYEPETRSAFEQIVKPGMTVVDVGAHIGYYTLLSATLTGHGGKVFAFEPDPLYHGLLRKNIAANNFGMIVELLNAAVGDKDREAVLFLGKSTGTSLFKVPDITGQTTITNVVSLDNFFLKRGWTCVDVIKIDIEGSEKLALEGMRGLTKRNPGLKLIIEVNPAFLKIAGTSAQDVITLLNELGFNMVRALSNNSSIYKLPQAAPNLLKFTQEQNYVNLLCERCL